MNTADQFAAQWQDLKEKRQRLIEEIEQLRQKSNSLTEDAAILQLFAEKKRLKAKVSELNDKIYLHQWEIDKRLNLLDRRHRAVGDQQVKQHLQYQLCDRRNRLPRLQETNAPQLIVDNEKRMIWELEAPLEEVECAYQQQNVEERQKQQAVQQIVNETLARIAAIDEHYRQTKQCLKAAIQNAEQRQSQWHFDVVEWATQSRGHLEWLLQQEPLYRHEVLLRYKQRFPADDISDLQPQPSGVAPVSPKATSKRRSAKPSAPVVAVAEGIVQPPVWRYSITFNPQDAGQELPLERQAFLKSLQAILGKAAYHNLNVKLVYDKLLAVSRMSMQQRQLMNKISGTEPEGWKILRVGKKHRLFLSIDEEKRHICFLPCPRKKSYSHH